MEHVAAERFPSSDDKIGHLLERRVGASDSGSRRDLLGKRAYLACCSEAARANSRFRHIRSSTPVWACEPLFSTTKRLETWFSKGNRTCTT